MRSAVLKVASGMVQLQRLRNGTPEEALHREAKLLELMEQNQRLKSKVAKAEEASAQVCLMRNEYRKLRKQYKECEVSHGLLKDSIARLESEKRHAHDTISHLEMELQKARVSPIPTRGPHSSSTGGLLRVSADGLSLGGQQAHSSATPRQVSNTENHWRERLIDAATPQEKHRANARGDQHGKVGVRLQLSCRSWPDDGRCSQERRTPLQAPWVDRIGASLKTPLCRFLVTICTRAKNWAFPVTVVNVTKPARAQGS
eukprot:scaffold3962_cov292-Prasinococcus_capsulatus_cf.AAC.2